MKAASPPEEREPLASPFELAQIAISLALLYDLPEPDLEGAVRLLRHSCLAVQEEKRPRAIYPTVVYVDAKPHGEYPLGTKIITPDDDPAAWRKHIEELRNFPGGDQIVMPKGNEFTLLQIIAAVTGRKEKKRNQDVFERMVRRGTVVREHAQYTFAGERGFWITAQLVAPFAPRFKHLYPKPNKLPRGQMRKRGRFHKPSRAENGQFKQEK